MHNIWLVAQHEFLTNIRKRSFLFAMFGVPALMGLIFAITFFTQIRADEDGIMAERIGYVEQSEVLSITDEMFISYATVGTATEALDAKEIDVFFVITPLYLSTGEVRLYSYGNVSDDTRDEIELFISENIVQSVVTDAPPERLIDPIEFTMFLQNTQRELTLSGVLGLFLTPMLFAVVLLMALQLSSTFLMAGVQEEKGNHIMEVLITSITPYQLLSGKLLGLGVLGLIQMLVWLGLGVIGLAVAPDLDVLSGIVLPAEYIITVLIYFVLTYFLFASLLAGIGAVVNAEQESRTLAGGVILLAALPIMFISALIFNPENPIFTVFFYVPFTSAMAYMLKYPFTPIPLWQVAISLSLLTTTTVFMTWASAKVFRWALLLYGKKPSISTLWSVIRGQQEMGVIIDRTPAKEKSA